MQRDGTHQEEVLLIAIHVDCQAAACAAAAVGLPVQVQEGGSEEHAVQLGTRTQS